MRTFGISKIAEREAAELDPGLHALMESFCAGVAAAVEEARSLPF